MSIENKTTTNPSSLSAYGINESTNRINLFGATSPTDTKTSTVAYQTLAEEGSWKAKWQNFLKDCGFLVLHTITTVDTQGKTAQQQVLLNVNSLAKRFGISKEQLQEATKNKTPQSKATTTSILKEKFETNIQLAQAGAKLDEEGIDLSKLAGRSIEQFMEQHLVATGTLGSGGFGNIWKTSVRVETTAHKTLDLNTLFIVKTLQKEGTFNFEALKAANTRILELNPKGDAEGIQQAGKVVTVRDKSGDVIGKGILMTRYTGSLDKLESRTSREQAKTMTLQLLRGLATIHEKGMIHSDIKPPNILVKGSPEALLFHIGDFDGAKHKEELRKDFNEFVEKLKTIPENLRARSISAKMFQLKGMCTPPYDPDYVGITNKMYSEAKALEEGNFEAWFAARQKADLFAMAKTIKDNWPRQFGTRETLVERDTIISDMQTGKTTAQDALKRFEALFAKWPIFDDKS